MGSDKFLNKTFCFSMGIITTAVMGYFAFIQPKDRIISSQKENFVQLQQDSTLLVKSIYSLTQSYEEKIDSLDNSLNVVKAHLALALYASNLSSNFQSTWLGLMNKTDPNLNTSSQEKFNYINKAGEIEKYAFYSMDLLNSISESYNFDADSSYHNYFLREMSRIEKADTLDNQ